jgi:hypothetical protein
MLRSYRQAAETNVFLSFRRKPESKAVLVFKRMNLDAGIRRHDEVSLCRYAFNI